MQGLADLFCKAPDSEHFSFAGPGDLPHKVSSLQGITCTTHPPGVTLFSNQSSQKRPQAGCGKGLQSASPGLVDLYQSIRVPGLPSDKSLRQKCCSKIISKIILVVLKNLSVILIIKPRERKCKLKHFKLNL